MKLSDINIRDPFIVPYEGKYYMYGTRGKGCWESQKTPGMGFDVYISEDLETWSDPIPVFEASDNFWGTHNFWAPEVHFYNGNSICLHLSKVQTETEAHRFSFQTHPTENSLPSRNTP